MPANRPARERFEFALDARQVASVILGSLAALGVTFYLGYALGQRVVDRPGRPAGTAPAPAAVPPADPLAVLDQPPRPDAGGPPPKLSYHETLTSPKPPPEKLPAPAARPPAAEAALASPPPSAPPSTAAPAVAPTPKPTPTATPAAAAPPPTRPAPAATPTPTPAPKAAPPPPVRTAPPPPAKSAPAARTASGGAFTVQVGATQDRTEADRIAARHAGRGAKVVVADVPGKGRWYRVRIGSFDTREAADRYLRDLERSTGTKGFVTSTP
jgi:DedD protein